MSSRTCLPAFVALLALAGNACILNSLLAQVPAPPVAIENVPAAVPPPAVAVQVEAAQPEYDTFIEWDNPAIDNVFTAPDPLGYYSAGHTVGSIFAVNDLYFPGTVNTVTQHMIHDQQALSMSDVLRNIGGAVQSASGLAGSGTNGIHPDQFLLRGLEVTPFNFRKNGFLDPTSTPRDFANVERIEVLKGPASVLYGAAGPSGTVNLVTKKALANRFSWGGITLGSDSLQRYQFDTNSMNESGDLLVRVSGAYQDGQSFRNFGYNERIFVAPVITKLYGSDTAVTWEGEFHQDRRLRDSGLIAVNGNTSAFGPEMFFGAPTDFAEFNDYRSTLSLTHRFNDWWQLYLGTSSVFYDGTSRATVPQTGFTTGLSTSGFYQGTPGLTAVLNRTQNDAVTREQNHAIIGNLSGEIDGPAFTHNLLIGAELDWFVVNNNRFNTSIPGLDPALSIDPLSGAQPFPGATPIASSFAFENPGYYQNRFGIYFQDMIAVADRWTVLAGVRWDTVRTKYDRELAFGGFPIFTPPESEETFDQVTPRAGVVYELVPETTTLYGLYTQSFSPPGREIYAQAPLGAETGEMWEVGLKTQLDDYLTFSVAAFYIERENVAVQITNFTVNNTAEQVSKGVELNLVGQWNERFSSVTNYTYADVEQFGPNGFSAYNGRVRGVPFGSGNIWTRYDFVQESDRTIGLGLGYVYVGERRGDYATPLRLPSYSRWDLGVYGQQGRWDLAAYVENIFNVRYETSSVNQYQVMPGAPANFRLQLGANF